MNKPKKTIPIHAYSKKIDEIIASGKPINEQLEEMMQTFCGVEFVDCTVKKKNSKEKLDS